MTLEWTPDPASTGDWVSTCSRATGEVLRYSVYEVAPGLYRAVVSGSKDRCLVRRGTLETAQAACQRHATEG